MRDEEHSRLSKHGLAAPDRSAWPPTAPVPRACTECGEKITDPGPGQTAHPECDPLTNSAMFDVPPHHTYAKEIRRDHP